MQMTHEAAKIDRDRLLRCSAQRRHSPSYVRVDVHNRQCTQTVPLAARSQPFEKTQRLNASVVLSGCRQAAQLIHPSAVFVDALMPKDLLCGARNSVQRPLSMDHPQQYMKRRSAGISRRLTQARPAGGPAETFHIAEILRSMAA